ncbi:MAG: hypothetical protein B7733_11455 [Myxococcales bacterium FL481]|nr:MAG: hypothetical protein B7733_11455 [Myxococcales bacterium FL481]
MAFEHSPLAEAELGPMVARMVSGPPQMRQMVAGGMAPLPPRDLVVGLYQLWVLNEDPFAEQAARTAESLPKPLFDGALGDSGLPAGVLDFLARKMVRNGPRLDQLVRHPLITDETIVGVARVCPDVVCDTLAENQVRWLNCPRIVESLYRNPNAKMSVVHRMLELAEREHLDLSLPGVEEIRAAMRGETVDPSRDGLFQRAMRTEHDELEYQLERFAASRVDDDLEAVLDVDDTETGGDSTAPADLDGAHGIDDAGGDGGGVASDATVDGAAGLPDLPPLDPVAEAAGASDAAARAAQGPDDRDPDPVREAQSAAAQRENRFSQLLQMRPLEKIRAALLGDQFDRSVLVRDSNKMVAMATIKSPKIRDDEVVGYSANRSLSHDVIRYLAGRRDWVRLYQVKFNLVMNPKTPLSRAMALLAHLHTTDVRKVARSKNISSALAKAAKRRTDLRR